MKALGTSLKSAGLNITVSLSVSPGHYEFNERKQPLGVAVKPTIRQKGQRLPGFSSWGRTKEALVHLRSRCVQIPGAWWLPSREG